MGNRENCRYRMTVVCRPNHRGSLPEITRVNVTAPCQVDARRGAIHQAMSAGWHIVKFTKITPEALI